LYNELLECLTQEWQALVNSQEEAILALAARKEHILKNLQALASGDEATNQSDQEREVLTRLKGRVAEAQNRNRRFIAAALETINEFLGHLQASPPGTYHSAGKVAAAPGASFFHRQA
jgi:flagellar biosynthesis/type III secretory pathway chaperone